MNMDRLTVVGLGVVIVSACAVTAISPNGSRGGDIPPWFDTTLDSLVVDSLRRFRTAAELERYRTRLRGGGRTTRCLVGQNRVFETAVAHRLDRAADL